MGESADYGPMMVRIVLGLLFIVPGVDKLMGMLSGGHMIAEMLGAGLAWFLLLVEIIFGIAVLVGYKVKLTVWPLAIILVVAVFMVHLPGEDPMKVITVLFHLLGVAALASLSLTGPGAYAVDKQ